MSSVLERADTLRGNTRCSLGEFNTEILAQNIGHAILRQKILNCKKIIFKSKIKILKTYLYQGLLTILYHFQTILIWPMGL
jgi:hypothetical protein